MCSINHDMKAIFIHIHKTGGTYISYILHKHYGFKNYYLHRPDHDAFCLNKKPTTKYLNYENRVHGVLMYYKTSPYINKKMGMTPQKWDTYYKFCFIRNPYDRIISGWYHVNKLNQSFSNYLSMPQRCNDVEFIHVFMPQVRNIINEKGSISNINFIGKFENLEEDLCQVLKNIGFLNIIHQPKNMNKRDHNPFYTYYSQDSLTKVNYILREDFKFLGFKMFQNINDFFDEYVKKENYMKIEDVQDNSNILVEDLIKKIIEEEEINKINSKEIELNKEEQEKQEKDINNNQINLELNRELEEETELKREETELKKELEEENKEYKESDLDNIEIDRGEEIDFISELLNSNIKI